MSVPTNHGDNTYLRMMPFSDIVTVSTGCRATPGIADKNGASPDDDNGFTVAQATCIAQKYFERAEHALEEVVRDMHVQDSFENLREAFRSQSGEIKQEMRNKPSHNQLSNSMDGSGIDGVADGFNPENQRSQMKLTCSDKSSIHDDRCHH